MASRMDAWFALGESVAARVLAGSPILRLVGPRDLSVAAVALYLGLDTVSRLNGESTTAETLFAAALGLAPLLGSIGGRGSRPSGGRASRIDIE
jgi:hypothetical protein